MELYSVMASTYPGVLAAEDVSMHVSKKTISHATLRFNGLKYFRWKKKKG